MQRLALVAAACCSAISLEAQTPARDASVTLERVLPSELSARVLQRIADARSQQLPAAALEDRALELAAKGVAPDELERALALDAIAMTTAKAALAAGGRPQPSEEEVSRRAL